MEEMIKTKVEVKPGIIWDNESVIQSEEATKWIQEEVHPRMAMNRREVGNGLVQPVYDDYRRPVLWVIDCENCTVTIEREYVDANSATWSLKKNTITVNAKENETI